MGSVKDLKVIEKPSETEMGRGRFYFSDRYSVFDWGEMPDEIPNKGKALCLMGAYCFEELEDEGVPTHYNGVVDKDGNLKSVDNLDEPTEIMDINLLRIIKPEHVNKEYDYSIYKDLEKRGIGNFLIPLEIIYRNGVPEGSSIFRRFNKGKIKPEDFGLEEEPKPGEDLDKPIFEVSTKLEEFDRYINWQKAKDIAAISQEDVRKIKEILNIVNNTVTDLASNSGFKNVDGKIELGFDIEREPILVDVVGTLDECRFTYDGIQVSKEIIRKYYRNTDWHNEVKKAKMEANKSGKKNWKKFCKTLPRQLDIEFKELTSMIYMSAANKFTGLDLFESPDIDDVIDSYKEYLK